MKQTPGQTFTVAAEQAQQTLAALLRVWLPGQSWSQVRKLVAGRRVQVNGELWLDDARRLKEGDTVDVLETTLPQIQLQDTIPIRYIDTHVVVVEKPSGVSTVRHPAEVSWSTKRRALVPTLDDLVLRQTGGTFGRRGPRPWSRLRVVQRLDKETSGLVVFARTVEAERGLGRQFKEHTVIRRYLALVPGSVTARTMRTHLVRDRGDGRRGSGRASEGKEAITHFEVAERLSDYTLLSCQLETGRTHQIRIHLAELGHPVCGEKVYVRQMGASSPAPDVSGAPRLALHAAELGFDHPITGEAMHWEMPLPPDLSDLLAKLRDKPAR